MDTGGAETESSEAMMQPPEIARWIVHHFVDLLPFGRPHEHVEDLDASQQAVERANRAVDAWNQRVAGGDAIASERQFWEEHGTPDDR